MAKLVFGCGYLGDRVAARWRDAGHEVFVVTRSAERAPAFAARGYRPIVADVARGQGLQSLPAIDTVLFSVGYDRAGGTTIERVFVDGVRNALDALPPQTRRFIYISSTGVYGQSQGQWVDETSPCQPTRDGGRACLAAEQVLMAHAGAEGGIILRMAGLYGPGRVPNADDVRQQRPLRVPREGFLNLIHVDDAATVVLAAESHAAPCTFVVSDGHPVQRHAYYQEMARLLHAPAPRFAEPPALSPAAARAAGGDKRVDNRRMREQLDVTLAYPSYREGLQTILADEFTPGAG